MLLPEVPVLVGAALIAAALVAATVLAYRRLRRRHAGAWFIAFPVAFPLYPALVLGAVGAPLAVLTRSPRACLIEGSAAAPAYARLRLFGAARYRLPSGAEVAVDPPDGTKNVIINATPDAFVLRHVTYSDMPIPGGGGKTDIAPGTVEYSTVPYIDVGGAPSTVKGARSSIQSRDELVPAP